MQHDLIEDIAKAIEDATTDEDGRQWNGIELRRAARAAHSVMSARVAELEEALRGARPYIEEYDGTGGEFAAKTLAIIDAALAPHPKAHE